MTKERYLVMYEISQKQNYIFRTNRLLENTGGSYIIRDLTENPHELFRTIAELPEFQLEAGALQLPTPVEKIVGGGSATYIFDKREQAQEFARELSSNIIRFFPGLELFLVQKEIDWTNELLYSLKGSDADNIIGEMKELLSKKKDRRQQAIFQESWGIQQACASSGLPANRLARPKQLKSETKEPRAEELLIKEVIGLSARDDTYTQRFITENTFLDNSEKYEFLKQAHLEEIFSKNSESDVKSYLSIISLDGNAMGIKVQKFMNQDFKNNDDYINEYQKFTKAIDDAYTRAFQRTIKHLLDDRERWEEAIYGNRNNNERLYKLMENVIPLRPVILSGDDVSFITFGVIGVEVARIYLQYLQKEGIEIDGKEYALNACAGVAIIPHRYPFWLGFQLADRLCDNGKKRLQWDSKDWERLGHTQAGQAYDSSLIDWQIVESGGAIENIEEFRSRYYTTPDQANLTMRPYYIQREEDRTHFASYQDTFYRAMTVIKMTLDKAENQADSNYPGRSKWKELRDVYHQGPAVVEEWVLLNQFIALASPDDDVDFQDQFFYTFTLSEGGSRKGFRLLNSEPVDEGKDYAFYYDALELLDYFVLLSEVKDS